MKNKKGFTLIELLIALAILAILGAVAVPIYTGYMSGSAKSEAKANLQTLAMLLDTYYSDNAKYTPATTYPTTYTWQNNESGTVTTNDFCSGTGCTGGSNWLPSFQPKKATGGTAANYRYTLQVTSATAYTATAIPERGPVLNSGNLEITEAGAKAGW